MKVEDILMVKGPDVIVAPPDTTVADAARMMNQADVGSVIIKDGDQVKGIFTERDLLKRVVAKGLDPHSVRLAEVMSSPIKSCRLEDAVHDCGLRLTREKFRHLAVMEDEALIGVIGLRDVMSAQIREAENRIRELESHGTD
ncbi:MAG: CBS domain-containing protein [Planctomycetes bacterium]|nr:CBS domain-containing protein [Planctomycetota bacterium]